MGLLSPPLLQSGYWGIHVHMHFRYQWSRPRFHLSTEGASHTPSIAFRHLSPRKDVVNQCLEFGCFFQCEISMLLYPRLLRSGTIFTSAPASIHFLLWTSAFLQCYTSWPRKQAVCSSREDCITPSSPPPFFLHLPPSLQMMMPSCLYLSLKVKSEDGSRKWPRQASTGEKKISREKGFPNWSKPLPSIKPFSFTSVVLPKDSSSDSALTGNCQH